MSVLDNPHLEATLRAAEPSPWPFMEKRRTMRVVTVNPDPTMTKSDMAAACDINNIMAAYKRTGIFTHTANGQPRYEDLPDAVDYQQAMNRVVEAQSAFEALPAELRDRFANEPARLLAFLADPNNRREAEQLGLITVPLPEQKVPESEVKSDPA